MCPSPIAGQPDGRNIPTSYYASSARRRPLFGRITADFRPLKLFVADCARFRPYFVQWEWTTATAYCFRMAVKPHEFADLHVRERALLAETVRIDPEEDRTAFLIAVGKITPSVEEKLRPLIDAETALSGLNAKIEEIEQKEKTLSADEARDRENLTALKGNDAAKRFVEELNSAEDQLQAARKQVADLEQQKNAAVEKLNSLIVGLSFDWDVKKD